MPRAGIALGSNLGDRLAHLDEAVLAITALATPGTPVLLAPIFETVPFQCPPDSPDFFNTVIEIDYHGEADDLLDQTSAIEARLGRTRSGIRNAPRVIDIDLLYFGGFTCQTDRLTLPHPRLIQRRFVLQPLAEICPNLILPGESRTIREILDDLPPQP